MLLGSRSVVSLLCRRGPLLRTFCSEPPASPHHTTLSLNEIIKTEDKNKRKSGSNLSIEQALQGIRDSVSDPGLQKDPDFLKWVKRLESAMGDNSGTSVKAEISGIRDLETLGLGDSFAVSNLENNLIWRCRNMTMEDLLFVLTFTRSKVKSIKTSPELDESNESSSSRHQVELKLYKETIKCLERRWTELSKPDHLITMIICSNSLTKSANEKIEDRLSDLSGSFAPSDLLNVIIAYAKVRRRPLNVLKNLVYHLRKNTDGIEAGLAVDGLFALSSLSLFDKDLIHSLAGIISNEESGALDKQSLSHCLVSMGRLRHYDEKLLVKISKELSQDLESLDYKTLHSYAMTSALLNFRSKDCESHANILKHILTHYSSYGKCLQNIPENKRDTIWLDMVWSLSLLGFTKPSLFESVLVEDFLHKIIYTSSGSNIGGLLKILNVNAVARYLEKDYNGPTLDIDSFPLLRDVNASSKSDAFQELCFDIFSNFASPPNHSKLNVNTGMGFCVGAEAVIHKKNLKPMDIEKYGLFGKEDKALPDEAKRLAMLPVNYFDCTLNGSMGGMMDLRIRLLESRGYKVLRLHHAEINAIPKKTDKVKLVEKHFKKVMS